VRIGWIGTGVMGGAMCGHLLDAGYEVTVSNRTPERAAGLLGRGATWAEGPAAVAAESEVVLAILGHPADVREVFLGPDGLVASSRPGTVLVDMTTSEPSLAVEIAAAAAAREAQALDAPVSGGDVGARNATLSIMVGGEESAVERVRPLLEVLGKNIAHQGPPGAGQHTKAVNQVLIATAIIGVCEGLLYAYRAGLDLERTIAAVAGGAAGSWQLENYGPRILAGDYAPGFTVEHFIKDMGIALAEARRMQLALPGLALAEQLYVALEAQGEGGSGTQALIRALARLSDVDF
jgi:3-hydroxyisobutyrate dehydrogenase